MSELARLEAGLRRRGGLTWWIEVAALGDWQRTGPGGQARSTDAAIQTSLILRMAFKLALRQTEGLMMSVLTLMGLTLSAPDHSTVSRRAVALPVIHPAQVPLGPLHVSINSNPKASTAWRALYPPRPDHESQPKPNVGPRSLKPGTCRSCRILRICGDSASYTDPLVKLTARAFQRARFRQRSCCCPSVHALPAR